MSSPSSALFQPIKVGLLDLPHRIVLAPLTRLRANNDHVLGDLGVQYYSQRASTPGTLLITESTIIAPQAGGFPNMPFFYTDAQIQAWKKVMSVWLWFTSISR
jgi:NADPH2 dehydrogenase